MVDEFFFLPVVGQGRWLFLSLSNNRYTAVEVHSNRVRLAVETRNIMFARFASGCFEFLSCFLSTQNLRDARCLAVALRQR